MVDFIIVGAGLAGCVLAERIASAGKSVLIIEKKNHIGGTCYDCYDDNGLLIHKYGPHIFNTDDETVWHYVNQFTEFEIYHHRVLGVVEGKKVPIPFNLESLYELFPHSYCQVLEKKLMEKYGMNVKVPIMDLLVQDDDDLKCLAEYIYEHVFLHYTTKQWGMSPQSVGGAAMARIPFYISRDDRYFQKRFQGIPKYGYTKMINNMLKNPRIHLLLNTDYNELIELTRQDKKILVTGVPFNGKLIFTGALDELFDYCYGELPYRTLDFKFETYDKEFFQEICTVNYPNNYEFTRITEFKYMTGQKHPNTTIVKEFPKQYDRADKQHDPYYPIPKKENEILYTKYRELSKLYSNLILSGRLADYKYYTMADTILAALNVFNKLNIN